MLKNKKAFTLIELLAVIIILGILMIIAIPAVTNYISESRKSAYIDTAKQVISGAKNLVNSGKLDIFDTEVTYYIPAKCVPSENGLQTPYGEFVQAYVVIQYTGNNYDYYWTSIDSSGIGIKDVVSYEELDTDIIESNLSPDLIKTDVLKGNTSKTLVLDGNSCKVFTDGMPQTPICKRVVDESSLHTATCSYSSTNCADDGFGYYGDSAIITFGKIGRGNFETGDAYDCDVNGDGNYSERFYYISDYYDTKTNTFDSSTAVLIYYTNTVNGVASTAGAPYATLDDIKAVDPSVTSTRSDALHGPVTAIKHLPTTQTWKNIKLKNTERAMLGEYRETHNATTIGGETLISNFSYQNCAARLLTAQEFMRGCDVSEIGVWPIEPINKKCIFLYENTKYASSYASSADGPWLETPGITYTLFAWSVFSRQREIQQELTDLTNRSVRPVIEISKSRIE